MCPPTSPEPCTVCVAFPLRPFPFQCVFPCVPPLLPFLCTNGASAGIHPDLPWFGSLFSPGVGPGIRSESLSSLLGTSQPGRPSFSASSSFGGGRHSRNASTGSLISRSGRISRCESMDSIGSDVWPASLYVERWADGSRCSISRSVSMGSIETSTPRPPSGSPEHANPLAVIQDVRVSCEEFSSLSSLETLTDATLKLQEVEEELGVESPRSKSKGILEATNEGNQADTPSWAAATLLPLSLQRLTLVPHRRHSADPTLNPSSPLRKQKWQKESRRRSLPLTGRGGGGAEEDTSVMGFELTPTVTPTVSRVHLTLASKVKGEERVKSEEISPNSTSDAIIIQPARNVSFSSRERTGSNMSCCSNSSSASLDDFTFTQRLWTPRRTSHMTPLRTPNRTPNGTPSRTLSQTPTRTPCHTSWGRGRSRSGSRDRRRSSSGGCGLGELVTRGLRSRSGGPSTFATPQAPGRSGSGRRYLTPVATPPRSTPGATPRSGRSWSAVSGRSTPSSGEPGQQREDCPMKGDPVQFTPRSLHMSLLSSMPPPPSTPPPQQSGFGIGVGVGAGKSLDPRHSRSAHTLIGRNERFGFQPGAVGCLQGGEQRGHPSLSALQSSSSSDSCSESSSEYDSDADLLGCADGESVGAGLGCVEGGSRNSNGLTTPRKKWVRGSADAATPTIRRGGGVTASTALSNREGSSRSTKGSSKRRRSRRQFRDPCPVSQEFAAMLRSMLMPCPEDRPTPRFYVWHSAIFGRCPILLSQQLTRSHIVHLCCIHFPAGSMLLRNPLLADPVEVAARRAAQQVAKEAAQQAVYLQRERELALEASLRRQLEKQATLQQQLLLLQQQQEEGKEKDMFDTNQQHLEQKRGKKRAHSI